MIDAGEAIMARIPEAQLTADQRRMVAAAAALLESRHRVVDESDIRIVDRASALLSSTAVWDRADDRQCGDQDRTFSLFCALQRASVEVMARYEHRRTALQEVRFAVEEASRGRNYEHRLRDYNNDPATRLEDIQAVLRLARSRLVARLAEQRACR